MCSEVADQGTPVPMAHPKKVTHYDEMNDKMFDIDMNVWNNARNVIDPI
jgi:hypothetical protein